MSKEAIMEKVEKVSDIIDKIGELAQSFKNTGDSFVGDHLYDIQVELDSELTELLLLLGLV